MKQHLTKHEAISISDLFDVTIAEFFVAGEPKTKGSTQSIPYRAKDGNLRVNTFNASKGAAAWERVARLSALEAWPHDAPYKGAVEIELGFVLRRPKTVKVRKRPLPIVKPDLDKLVRSVLDALSGVVFEDDAQVTGLMTVKRYEQAGAPVGVQVHVLRSGAD